MKECKAESGLKVTPISWTAAIVEQVDADGVEGVAINRKAYRQLENVVTEHDLPVEFFNHQLMDCDPEDRQALMDFMAEWGLLFSPFRSAKVPSGCRLDAEQVEASISRTAVLEERMTIDYGDAEAELGRLLATGAIDEADEDRVANMLTSYIGEPAAGRVVSLDEAASTLRILQKVVEIVRKTARDGWENLEELYCVIGVLNAGSCNSLTVQLAPNCFYGLNLEADRGGAYRVCLTSAICNQIIACLADKTPWRICECEGCNRVFKRKQAKTSSPNCDSKYCCDPCMERQKKRNQRKSAKNRIKH